MVVSFKQRGGVHYMPTGNFVDYGTDVSCTLASRMCHDPDLICFIRGGQIAMASTQECADIHDGFCPTLYANNGDKPILCYVDGQPCEIILRRITPRECGRLQGMPDWWCDDIPHSDAVEYKMWGNGMALPNVLYVMEGLKEALEND